MKLHVVGGSKFHKELAKNTVLGVASMLMHSNLIKGLEIRLKIGKIQKNGYYGICTWLDDNLKPREFEVTIDQDQSIKDFVSTICHEMVHVKQWAKGEMKDLYKGGHRVVWKGSTSYNPTDPPWEKEASELEDKLAQKLWNENKI